MFDGYYAINLEVNKTLVNLPDVKTTDRKSRGLDITRTLNGVVQNTAGQVIMLNAKTPDNRSVCALADVQNTDVGRYLLTYPTTMMTVAGNVSIELTIIDPTGVISTNTGTVNVVQAVANYGDVEDDPNFPALLQAMQQIQTMQDQITAMQSQISVLEHFETGAIVMSATALNSDHWLPMDGRSTSGYSGLEAIYGANLPNMNGRIPVQIDNAQSEFNGISKTGGEKNHVLTVAELANHSHSLSMYQSIKENAGHYFLPLVNNYLNGGFNDRAIVYANNKAYSDEYIDSTGSGSAHNNLQPYVVIGKFYVHI